MRFLVFSDSHGSLHCMREMTKRNIGHLDGVLFCGDGYRDFFRLKSEFPDCYFLGVQGNCDTCISFCGERVETHEILPFAGHRIYLCHGHKENCKYSDGLLQKTAREHECDIVLHGHTHSQRADKIYYEDGTSLLLCNPGSAKNGHFGVLELEAKNIIFQTFDINHL